MTGEVSTPSGGGQAPNEAKKAPPRVIHKMQQRAPKKVVLVSLIALVARLRPIEPILRGQLFTASNLAELFGHTRKSGTINYLVQALVVFSVAEKLEGNVGYRLTERGSTLLVMDETDDLWCVAALEAVDSDPVIARITNDFSDAQDDLARKALKIQGYSDDMAAKIVLVAKEHRALKAMIKGRKDAEAA